MAGLETDGVGFRLSIRTFPGSGVTDSRPDLLEIETKTAQNVDTVYKSLKDMLNGQLLSMYW